MNILVGGQLGSGKDTVADYLAEKLGLPWVRGALATLVKQIFQDTFSVDRQFIEDWKRSDEIPPGFHMPMRDCLIMIGDGFRKIKDDVWIQNVFAKKNEYQPLTYQILSDGRYVNEANYVRENNGISILLWRPGFENNINNGSEQEYMPFIKILRELNFDGEVPAELNMPFNLWIRNDGDIKDLYNKIDNIVIPYILNAK